MWRHLPVAHSRVFVCYVCRRVPLIGRKSRSTSCRHRGRVIFAFEGNICHFRVFCARHWCTSDNSSASRASVEAKSSLHDSLTLPPHYSVAEHLLLHPRTSAAATANVAFMPLGGDRVQTSREARKPSKPQDRKEADSNTKRELWKYEEKRHQN